MQRVLIANRGEVAVRIARACADYGLESVAVYSDPDADALHVRVANHAWGLPGTTSRETYLDVDKLLDAAVRTGADAVHPGYGFLSESPDFARRVVKAGLTWIGPLPETIEILGDKTRAREVARSVGAPLLPSSDGVVSGPRELVEFADSHGLPVVIKAVHGGGGRGMRVVRRAAEAADAYESAVREATASFGRGECFVEKFLERPRHVEVQVVGDRFGRVMVLGTRDCSVQRRGQKLVEEAPARALTDEQSALLTRVARDLCAAVGYQSLGTVEFLIDSSGEVTFLEVNPRLQVEHPVTEATSGQDLVRLQFLVADGHSLDSVAISEPSGHAIEFRINAEDPGRGFLAMPGVLERLDLPGGPGVRVDSGVVAGAAIPAHYDSLLAKLIVTGPDRHSVLRRAGQALAELELVGVPTLVPFHRRLLSEPAFVEDDGARMYTRWVEEECYWLEELARDRAEQPPEPQPVSTWVEIDGRRHRLRFPTNAGAAFDSDAAQSGTAEPVPPPVPGAVLTSVAGTLVRWEVADGDAVEAGQTVAVMEAMKMEAPVQAPSRGRLRHRRSVDDFCPFESLIAIVE